MTKTTIQVGGMQCGMCESHINDAIRRAFQVKKVTSSRSKGTTVILSDEALDTQALRRVLAATGYDIGEISQVPCEKRGLFGRRQ